MSKLRQAGDAAVFQWAFVAPTTGTGVTGLTVAGVVSIYQITAAGTPTLVASGLNAVEVGGGVYIHVLSGATPTVAGADYIGIMTTTGAVAQKHQFSMVSFEANVTAARAAFLDAAVTSRAAAADYTTGRAAKLDYLDAAVTTRAAIADYTSGRAALLDRLDVVLSTRAAASDLAADYAAIIAAIATRAADADVQTLLTRLTSTRAGLLDALALLDVAVSTRLATAGYTVPPTVVAIADATMDELLSGHVIAGSAGAALTAAAGLGDPMTHTPEEYTPGQIGALIGYLRTRIIEVASMVTDGGTLDLYHGDDYSGGGGIPMAVSNPRGLTITGARLATASGPISCTVITATGDTIEVVVDPAQVDVDALPLGQIEFRLIGEDAGGDHTLGYGIVDVQAALEP